MNQKVEVLFSRPIARTLASTLLVLLVSILISAGASLYLPITQADSIGLPILLFPFIWLALFLFSTMTESILLVYLVLIGLGATHIYLIANSLGFL